MNLHMRYSLLDLLHYFLSIFFLHIYELTFAFFLSVLDNQHNKFGQISFQYANKCQKPSLCTTGNFTLNLIH